MPNLVSDKYNKDSLQFTPVFPVKTNTGSSEVGESIKAVPRLKVTTDLEIKKVSDILTVGKTAYDISHKNILDIFNILTNEGVSVSFLDNTNGWDLPASCIKDFTNKEYNETMISHIPFSLESVNTLKNQGIVGIGNTQIKAILVIDMYSNQKSYKQNESYIVDIKNYSNRDKVVYTVFSPTFLIKVSPETFTTTKTDIIAKHMDKEIR